MRQITIPRKLKATFQRHSRELILKLNQELEDGDCLYDGESLEYLSTLSQITDKQCRHQAIMKAFAEALCE